MTPEEDRRIDSLLRESGEEWRTSTVARRDVDVRWFEGNSVQGAHRLRAAAAVGAALVLGLFAVVIATQLIPNRQPSGSGIAAGASPTHAAATTTQTPSVPPITPSPQSASPVIPTATPASLLVLVGDRVTASGNILGRNSGVDLCPGLIFAGPNPGCKAFIALLGVDPRTVPGGDRDGMWVTTYVTVVGTWTGSAIQVTDVTPSDEPDEPSTVREVPCGAPDGGWPGNGADMDIAAERLAEEIDRHPETYVGPWVGSTAGTGVRALGVGTVGNVETAYADLGAVYAYNLCIVQVEFSAQDLRQASERLHGANSDWHTTVDPSSNRVILTAAVFDQELADAVAPYGNMIAIDAIVKPID